MEFGSESHLGSVYSKLLCSRAQYSCAVLSLSALRYIWFFGIIYGSPLSGRCISSVEFLDWRFCIPCCKLITDHSVDQGTDKQRGKYVLPCFMVKLVSSIFPTIRLRLCSLGS
jgi:hypothetical protein